MNATQALPEIILNLDRPRRATFDARALNALEAYYEEKTGKARLWDAVDFRNMNIRTGTRVLWACLLTDARDNNEVLTFDDVETIVDAHGLIRSVEGFKALLDEIVSRAQPVLDSEEVKAALAKLDEKKTGKKPTPEKTPTNQEDTTGSGSSPSESSTSA